MHAIKHLSFTGIPVRACVAAARVTPLTTGLRQAAQVPASAVAPVQRRHYISAEALSVLEDSPAGRTLLERGRFGRSGVVGDSASMTREASEALTQLGALSRPDVHEPTVLQRLRGVRVDGLAMWRGPIDAQTMVDLNHKHGPLQLMLHNMRQPGQGRQSSPATTAPRCSRPSSTRDIASAC